MSKLAAIHQRNQAIMGERNGKAIPLTYGDLKEEHKAVRHNILMTDYSHFGIASVSGESAYELLNLVVAGDVSAIRDEQAMYSVILDDEGHIVTDLYILCDDERFILISEWVNGEAMCTLLRNALEGKEEELADIQDILSLDDELGILHFEGPYCWELLAELYGMDVVGLPFQEHMHIDDNLLLRSGKHGEFSYKLIAPRDELADAWLQAQDAGEKYDLRLGGLDYQRLVRLENPCWEPALLPQGNHCPIELQMQWAIRYDKEDFVGINALRERLEHGVSQRAVGLLIPGQPAIKPQPCDGVFFNDEKVGWVINGGYSEESDAWFGRLMLNSEYAYADIPYFHIQTASGSVPMNTAATPFIRNFSFLVNPTEHSYIDSTRPKHLLEQLEWKKQKEQEEKERKAAEESAEAQASPTE
ncbi:aminomethyl transferase family protein [Edaphovirga cremea]|uniref:aminomethyl transferase family protein n=1 Tax=Edaphovirga cremea TaxID=2267246 RepID=UPI003989B061